MLARQLIIAVLIFLSLSAQASTALLSCERAGSPAPDCCDPLRPMHGCPVPSMACLSCDQGDSTAIAASPLATLEGEPHTPPLDPFDLSTVAATHLYRLLAISETTGTLQRLVEPSATRGPTNPIYLATARLRL